MSSITPGVQLGRCRAGTARPIRQGSLVNDPVATRRAGSVSKRYGLERRQAPTASGRLTKQFGHQ